MAYTSAQGREQILDALAEATDHVALALACLTEAYEHVDDRTADQLEEALFRPVQLAYGRAKRTHAEFAARHGLPTRAFESRSPGAVSQTTQDLINRAADSAGHAAHALAELQDSMLPVEVGDDELRAALPDLRRLIDDVPSRARTFVRTIGR